MAPTAAEATHLGEMVSLATLFPSPLNPRKRFPEGELRDLAANIEKHGVIVPLLGRRQGAKVEVIDGERRFRAASMIALTMDVEVPVVFRDGLTDGDVIEIQLLSAIQRQDLTPLEEAAGFKSLIDSNKSKYSVAYIADRVGRSEKWVWDRMKLLDLIPEIKELLEAERILVGHAELLARLKPEDQKRALDYTRHHHAGKEGLWQTEVQLTYDDDDDQLPTAKNLYRGLKPVTVKELEAWIARHVRFDVAHMAAAAPLDFGPTAVRVEEALAQPGRRKKVIAITHDYRVDDDAKDPSDRTYGSQSWRRADGQEKSKECEHSVLGVVAAGPGYGTSFKVCVARDKCTVHFAKELKEREKTAKLRSSGKGASAAQREQKAQQQDEARRVKEEAERKAWDALRPEAIKAIVAHVMKRPAKQLLSLVAGDFRIAKGVKVRTADDLIRGLAAGAATGNDWYLLGLTKNAKRYGFDLGKWIAEQKPETADATPAKAAKRAKKR
jgi:ParB/RepB/Spo0J family partition protein